MQVRVPVRPLSLVVQDARDGGSNVAGNRPLREGQGVGAGLGLSLALGLGLVLGLGLGLGLGLRLGQSLTRSLTVP